MSRGGEHVRAQKFYVNGNVSDGLNRVRVKNFLRRVCNFRKRFNRLNRADFVVGEHDGNNFCLRTNFFLQVGGIDCAELVDGQCRHAATQIFHRGARIQNCFVFDGGSDDVRAFAQMRKHARFYRPIIAFGAARRENNFMRLGVNASSNFFSRLPQNFFQRTRKLVSRRRIGKKIFLQVNHQSQRVVVKFGSRGVVCVNNFIQRVCNRHF